MSNTSAAPGAKSPINPPSAGTPTETLVRNALDDIVVVVGGAAALHQLDDDVVWSVMKRLDRIRVRLLRDLKGLAPRNEEELNGPKPPRVHPAVDEFLARNRAGMGE
jgi:hypothetical protein